MEALVAEGVSRAYGKGNARTEVLKDLSLTLPAGAFAALMGPSGCGKSTFLHLAAGLLAADAGTIRIAGEEITAMSDAAATRFRRRRVGVVFQDFNLIETLSVADNITLPVRLDGRKPNAARLASLLARLGLSDKERRRPAELSGGERQRVAIARALFAEPAVILADEPTGNLDTRAAREICALLRTLNETEKVAILLVTHDPMVAAAADTVHFLRQGTVAVSFPTQQDAGAISAHYLETYGA